MHVHCMQREEMETVCKCCCLFSPKQPRRFHSRNTPPPPDAPPPPEDVGALFSLHAGGAPHMDEDGLRRCLGVYQGGGEGEGFDEDDDTKDLERLLEQIRGTGGIPRQQVFTVDDFHRILFSHDVNPAIRRRGVHHDMTLPLSHYFIYSGHGGRSDEPIIRALKMGVRAIEVAMWPTNPPYDDIKIHRGWTQNTPVLLTECFKSIKENAFVASPYPVIITLEDNLSTTRLQKKAAKVLLDVFGDTLYWPHTYHVDVHGNADINNPLKEFPSPEELKGRVLLSIKPPQPQTYRPMKVDETNEQQGDATAWGAEVQDFQTETQPAKKHDGDASGSGQQRRLNDEFDDEDQKEQPHEYPPYHHLITIRPEKQGAAERVTYTREMVPRVSALKNEPVPEVLRRGGLNTTKTIERMSTLVNIEPYPSSEGPPPAPEVFLRTKEIEKVSRADALHSEPGEVRRLSWSKQQIEKAAKDRGNDIVRFTQKNILQIYPGFSTSNYNPILGWVHGAQMVVLNLQEYGRALWLMHGFYRANNGGCGYVRKPDFLIQTEPEVFDPRKRQPVKKTLKVKVYMGDGWFTDFKPAHTSFIPDLWASVGIAGVLADTTAMQNTEATEKTWVPVWEDEEFSFDLTVPEIALLRVEVHQYDASEKVVFGGQTVLPVWELRPGIRAVALFDHQGNSLPNVKLLMRFEFV